MQFVDMPGAERLAIEPELLRLREGIQLNKGLLAFSSLLQNLAAAKVQFVSRMFLGEGRGHARFIVLSTSTSITIEPCNPGP